MRRAVLTSLCVLLLSGRADAEQAPGDSQRAAAQHFEQGLLKGHAGEVKAALNEFEAAYELQPNFSVLYNIGQAHLALGEPLQAVEAFERYLSEGGAQVTEERRREVQSLIETGRRQLGHLKLTAAAPARTRVWLDGAELSADTLGRAIPLPAGKHTLLYAGTQGPPSSQVAEIEPQRTVELTLPAPEPPSAPLGQLLLQCDVPGVEVQVGDAVRTRTPAESPLLVAAGALSVRFSRSGYAPVTRSVQVEPGRLSRVACDLEPLSPIPPLLSASLRVRTTPKDARVLLDARPFHGQPLVAGPHLLRVERDGFVPVARTISVRAGKTLFEDETLQQTPSARERAHAASHRRALAGWLLLGGGAAALGSAAGVYAWNTGRYDDIESSQGPTHSVSPSRAASIQRADDLAVGLTLAGAGLALGGSWLLVTPE